jgi:hypothetical protein
VIAIVLESTEIAMKKVIRLSNRGGARPGAGRPRGENKARISITIEKNLYGAAKGISGGNFSGLVESALVAHLARRQE